MSGLVSRIHQGRYDSETELLRLRKNAMERNAADVIDAIRDK